jgi:hypothetical protein
MQNNLVLSERVWRTPRDRGMQLETQSADHFKDRGEVRAATTREGLVEALPRQAGVTCHLGSRLHFVNAALVDLDVAVRARSKSVGNIRRTWRPIIMPRP